MQSQQVPGRSLAPAGGPTPAPQDLRCLVQAMYHFCGYTPGGYLNRTSTFPSGNRLYLGTKSICVSAHDSSESVRKRGRRRSTQSVELGLRPSHSSLVAQCPNRPLGRAPGGWWTGSWKACEGVQYIYLLYIYIPSPLGPWSAIPYTESACKCVSLHPWHPPLSAVFDRKTRARTGRGGGTGKPSESETRSHAHPPVRGGEGGGGCLARRAQCLTNAAG